MSVTTAQDIIISALKRIRVLGKGDILDSEDANDSLDILNMMLESWSLDKLYVFEEAQVNFPFIGGKQDYTIGPGGDFSVASRPLKLVSAFTRSNRSEEHTSELQSPKDLVCRLLLEKK